MAKKNFDRDSRDVFGLKAREALQDEGAAGGGAASQAETPAPAAEARQGKEDRGGAPGEQGERLIQRSYYITPALEKAIRMRIATSSRPEDKDKSAIVRAALALYLEQP